jgi:phage pi2 protein 07
MGYWGYYPSDNDDSWDLKSKTDAVINDQLDEIFAQKLFEEKNVPDFMMKKELKRRKHDELFAMWHRVGLVQLLLQSGVFVRASHIALCVHYLYCLETDYKMFSKGWKNSVEFERSFKKVKGAFEKLLKDNKTNDEILASRGWLRRPWEKPGASWTGCVEAVEKDLQEEEKNG